MTETNEFEDLLKAVEHIPGQSSARELLYGVPLPNMSLRYFFSSSVLPASKIYLLAGQSGTGKTSLMLEFFRIIMQHMHETYNTAFGYIVHTEDKWPDTLPPSILGSVNKYLKVNTEVKTIQSWQSYLSGFMRGGAGKNIPIGAGWKGACNPPLNKLPLPIGLDSIAGAQGEERHKKIQTAGASSRDFSEIAARLSDWFPSFTKWIKETSSLAFFILHGKMGTDGFYTTGGTSKDFFSSYTVYLTDPKKKVDAHTKNGVLSSNMQLYKDSYGPGGVTMPVYMTWDYDEDGNQLTTWDWDRTTVEVLSSWFGTMPGRAYLAIPKKHALWDLFSGWTTSAGGPKGTLYSCDRINPGDGTKGYTYKEFSQALESDTEFRLELDKLLRITQRKTCKEYFDSLEAETEVKETAKRRGRKKKVVEGVSDDSPKEVVTTEEDVLVDETQEV